jgi:predicted transcriptional regulator
MSHAMARGVISYRNKTDVAMQILEIANEGGVTKYQISYEAFLNYSQLKEILPMLIENGLLSYESTIHTFKTTEKGFAFLQTYNQMNEMLKERQV